jgi:hypothetical protein
MLGLTSYLPTAHRERAIVLAMAIASIFCLSVLAPSSAHASGCSDSWTNTAGGSWFEGSNWSNSAPPTSGEEACITAAGTYTVTMTQESGTVSVKSLTVGGTSGKQTLAVGSSCSVNAILTTTAGISNGAQGAITLTNGDGCGDGVKLVGPITNAGTLTVEPEHGGARELQGSITNTGTLSINASTAYNGTSVALTNKGTLNVAEGKTLSVAAKNSFTNGTSGKIVTSGNGDVLIEKEASFTEGTGTTSGTQPVIVDDGALNYTGSGKSLIALRGSSTLSGSLTGSQSLAIQSTCSENVVATAAASFTNAGTITLTNGDGCGDNVTLAVSAGTLTNSGKIITEVPVGGTRTIQGNLTNTGTLSINANTAYNGTSAELLNDGGALNIAEGKALTVSEKGSVENVGGGRIAAGATGALLMEPGTSFTESEGSTSGALPVIVRDAALTYAGGSGSSTIAQRGEGSTLSGGLHAGETLLIESTCSENAKTTAGENFHNEEGTIKLTNGDGCGNNVTLIESAGALFNRGKIAVEQAIGGARTIQGNLTNSVGTLSINANTAYNGASATLVNSSGALNIAEGKALTVSEKGSVENYIAGNIAAGATGALVMEPGTSFTENGGTTSGALPVIVRDAALTYGELSNSGSSTIAQRGEGGTLNGDLSDSQTLLLQSTCSENAKTTASSSFTNEGTITLTNGDGCGNNVTLAVSEGTLTNSGKIITETPVGGARTIQGNLTNTGTLSIKANTAYNESGALLTNQGALNIAEGAQLAVTGGGTVTNGSGGTIFAPDTAALSQSGGTFVESAGKTIGTVPVILDDATLNYTGTSTEHGSGPIALRGTSNFSGTVRSGETLVLQSTCSENAVATAAGSFNNNGTLELTNGDGCGNNVTLNLKGGTLTNNGTLNIDEPNAGSRTIQGNVTNAAVVGLGAGATLQLSGNYTQASSGRLKTFIASSSSFGSMSVSGTATIAGTLILRQGSFKASLGQKYAILSGASLTGTFATESEDQVNSTGLYYQPTYSATGVTLAVTQATLAASSAEGAPGATVTLSGSGYLPGDTITPTFTDHSGVKTVLPTVTVNGSGEFSTEITIPATAALGKGTITTKSTDTGVHISNTYKVT